jgi:GIY-YIG catalytic domain
MLAAAKYIGAGLATIGLITKNILKPTMSDKVLTPSILSNQAIKAIECVDSMLQSLPLKSIVLKHIEHISKKSALKVNADIKEGKLVPNKRVEFYNGEIPEKQVPQSAGVYLFELKTNGEQYVGSAIDFRARVRDHKYQFEKKRKPTVLHITGDKLGGLKAFFWAPVYFTPNYLDSFIASNPNYDLSQGELDILLAITQLVPRILEQSLCTRDIFEITKDSLSFKLNGSSGLVLFTYTSWDPATLNWKIKEQVTAKLVEILIDGNVVRVVGSIEMCATVLGLSRNTVMRYMNHVKSVYSKHLNAKVNVRFPQSLTKTDPIIHRKNREIEIPSLVIPDKSLYDLELNLLYVFDSNFNQIGMPFLSIAKAVEFLNPSLQDKKDRRGREINSARLTNKALLIAHELGQYYFAQHPNTDRKTAITQGVYPIYIIDIKATDEQSQKVLQPGIKPAIRYIKEKYGFTPDYKTVFKHYKEGTIYRKQFKFIA